MELTETPFSQRLENPFFKKGEVRYTGLFSTLRYVRTFDMGVHNFFQQYQRHD